RAELACLAAPPPQDGVSTNSTTWAYGPVFPPAKRGALYQCRSLLSSAFLLARVGFRRRLGRRLGGLGRGRIHLGRRLDRLGGGDPLEHRAPGARRHMRERQRGEEEDGGGDGGELAQEGLGASPAEHRLASGPAERRSHAGSLPGLEQDR